MSPQPTGADRLEAVRELAETLGEIAGRQAAEQFTALNAYLRGFAKALRDASTATAPQPGAETEAR